MPNYLAPGLYVEEIPSGNRPIQPVSTSVAAFVGVCRKGPLNRATLITDFGSFVRTFGGAYPVIRTVQEHYLYYAVRHFYEQGGGVCFIVRVVPNDATAAAATTAFDGRRFDTTLATPANVPVTGALSVAAANPGDWGEGLSVQLSNMSPYALLLAADIAATDAAVTLAPNADVRTGALLWLVTEVSATVASVTAAVGATPPAVTFDPDFLPLSVPPAPPATAFGGNITTGMTCYSADLDFFARTQLTADVAVAAGAAAGPVALAAPTNANGFPVKSDGTALRAGDTLTFALTEELVVVTRVAQATTGTPPPMIATLAAPMRSGFAQASSRVYGRTLRLEVLDGTESVETHENLSLVNADQANHVTARLGPDSGGSSYVVATDTSGALDDIDFVNSGFVALTNGDDGLTGGNLDLALMGDDLQRTGLHALDPQEDVSILCVPNASQAVAADAIAYAGLRRSMVVVFEQPSTDTGTVTAFRNNFSSEYASIYHPWLVVPDAVTGLPVPVPPCGAVAGIYARTDGLRGVHKAPAGLSTGRVTSASRLDQTISKGAYDLLYGNEINAIRAIPEAGFHVWGARTISADPDWRYVNVRRLFIMMEQSILRSTGWAVFEPNDPTLWKALEQSVTAFLRIQWLEGRLVGETEAEAFFVRCNAETNPPESVDAGRVITLIGAAPSKPAEFVIFRIQQLARAPG